MHDIYKMGVHVRHLQNGHSCMISTCLCSTTSPSVHTRSTMTLLSIQPINCSSQSSLDIKLFFSVFFFKKQRSSFLKRISFFTKRKRIFIPVFWRLSLRPEFSCRKVFVLPAPNLGDKEQDSPYPMLCEEGGGYFLLEMTTQSKGGALGVAKEERRDIYAIQVMKMKRIMLIWVSEDVF